MREYEPLWIKLKQNGIAKVAVPRPLHRRVIKAVKKEKYMDIGFKILCDKKQAVLSHTREHSMIIFKLTYNLVGTITVDDI